MTEHWIAQGPLFFALLRSLGELRIVDGIGLSLWLYEPLLVSRYSRQQLGQIARAMGYILEIGGRIYG